jgi:AcrR family transcriptional regulator
LLATNALSTPLNALMSVSGLDRSPRTISTVVGSLEAFSGSRASARFFWAHGYDAVTLDDLQAAMGGITPPSFYAAFGSKEKLFREAVELYGRTIGNKPVLALAEQPTARAAVEVMLRESVKAFCGSGTPRGCLIVLGTTNCSRASKDVQDHLTALRRQVPLLIRRRLERGVAEGDLPAGVDMPALTSFYTTVLHGLAIRARDGASRKALMSAVDGAMAAWTELTTAPR